jgi:glycosyltransferase involved in cell wall biosynthesis
MKDLFTVCITHYNQMEYIFTAIDSALNQNYPNIELIISDDGSKFDKTKVQKYINDNKRDNIKNVIIITRSSNVGTVKNMNNVIKKANGKYITFFAADDELSNENVITNYFKAFNKYNKNVITAQAFLYDKDLLNNNGPYVDVKKAMKFNQMDTEEVFYYVAQSCLYASGATAYRMELFNKYGLFNESYLLVEDWSYYLHLLKNNEQIFFVNFDGLNHRDGGVSHYEKITPTVKKYYEDVLKIYEKEILNDMPDISNHKKIILYNKCKNDIKYICSLIKSNKKNYYLDLINKSTRKYVGGNFEVFKATLFNKVAGFLKWQVFNKFRYLNRSRHIFVISIIYWFIINAAFLNNYYVGSTYEYQLLLLLSSLVGSCFVANLFIGIGDTMEYCVPISLILLYNSNVLSSNSIVKILLLFLLIYIMVYYVLFIIKILLNKIKEII